MTVKKTIFLSLTVLFRYQRIISTDKYLIFSSVTVLSGYGRKSSAEAPEKEFRGSIRPIMKRLEWPDAVTVLPKAEQ